MRVKDLLSCQTIGDRIRHVRSERNMTQRELGEMSGIAEPTIRRYELGKLNPKYNTLKKIAKALGCSVQFLQDGNPKVGDMTTRWKTGNRITFSLEIDSDLLSAINSIAADEGKTVNEKIEDTLWWEVEHYCEAHDDITFSRDAHDKEQAVPIFARANLPADIKVSDAKPWDEMTKEEKLAEFALQLDEEEASNGEEREFGGMAAG